MTSTALADDGVYIVGIGLQVPVGRSAKAAAAAVRAGISAYREHEWLRDERGAPIVAATASWLDSHMAARDRMLALGRAALAEALCGAPAAARSRPEAFALHLAVSETLLTEPTLQRAFAARLLAVAPELEGSPLTFVAENHASGLAALARAFDELGAGARDFALIGGLDSWLDVDRLAALEAAARLHAEHHSWGFTPGEGASFCLLARGSALRSCRVPPLARVRAISLAEEPNCLGVRTVCTGEGLTRALRGALPAGKTTAQVYCDLNGEPYRADEFAFAACRVSVALPEVGSFIAPASCWGDLGAATSCALISLPLAAWDRGYARRTSALILSSSAATSLRGAALLTTP